MAIEVNRLYLKEGKSSSHLSDPGASARFS
jgi:hypothetical protein